MKIGFTVSDIQDFHLYGFLLDSFIENKKEVFILYDKEVSKTTSPRKNKSYLSQFDCPKYGYRTMDECISIAKNEKCDIVITNEGQPFQGKIQLPFRLIGLSWTMEYYVHGPRFLNLCERFYVDCSENNLKYTYDLSPYNVIYDKHPKYYILNNKSKYDICRMLELQEDKKFVTFLGPAPAQKIGPKIKDMFRMGSFFKSLGYTIIVKQKPKCPDLIKICNYDHVLLHKHKRYSTSLMLSYISDFVIGFNSSGVVESIRTDTPFINLYLEHKSVNYKKHPVSKVIFDKLLRIDNFNEFQISQFVERNRNCIKRTDFEIDTFFTRL